MAAVEIASGDQIARTTTLVSQPSAAADPAEASFAGASQDGSRVFFRTTLRLTTDDNDTGREDVYEWSNGTTTLISQPTGVPDPDSGAVEFVGASADGSHVFLRTTQKLTPGDDDGGHFDIYERVGGSTTLVSQPTGMPEPALQFDVSFAGSSADGTRVFFATIQKLTPDDDDSTLGDVYERSGETTTLLSKPTGISDSDSDNVNFGGASRDGSHVFFTTTQRMVPADNDTAFVDVYERSGGITTFVSAPSGVPDPNTDEAFFAGVSADGSRVFFNTTEKLSTDDNDSGHTDTYLHAGGVTTLLTQPTGVPDPDTGFARVLHVSENGERAIFQTPQKLSADDTDSGRLDWYERSGATTTLLSQPTGVPDLDISGTIVLKGASADGSRVFFDTDLRLTADDDDGGGFDIYERAGGVTTLISKPTGLPDPPLGSYTFAGASADGSRVFLQTALQLTPDDTDAGTLLGNIDIYERAAGVTTLLSAPVAGADPGSDTVFFAGASTDGRRVFLQTTQRLTGDDLDIGLRDVFMAADTTSPETTITDGPSGVTADPTPTFSFSSSEPESAFECSVDGGAFAACAAPLTLAPLADGQHRLDVRARDNVGNVDPSPAARAFAIDTTAAVLSRLRLSPSLFRAAARGASIAARRPIGTRVSYRLSESALVRLTVERAAPGRRVGGRCRRPTARNRNRPRCVRYVVLRGSFTHAGNPGPNRFKFRGRLRGRKLRPGKYRLRAQAVDPAGNVSKLARTPFRIVRR
jgi:hypothetical protein